MKTRLVSWLMMLTMALGTCGYAQAQADKMTRILVGFPPGQATDLVARMVAERLTVGLGHPVIVENRPGQGGSIVMRQLAKAPPDGSVLTLSALAAYVVNPHLYKNAEYDSVKDLAPIGLVADLPLLLVTHPSVPANSLKELIEHAKANPGKLAYSSSGNGTLSHLLMEDLKHRTGIAMLHAPYQGSARAMVDLMGGTVQVGLDTVAVTQPHIKTGKLRLIATGTAKRLAAFPDTPTIAELGHEGFEASAWIALAAPAGTPLEIRSRINEEVNKALRSPEFVEKLLATGALPRPSTVSEFGEFLKAEQTRWRGIVQRSALKVD